MKSDKAETVPTIQETTPLTLIVDGKRNKKRATIVRFGRKLCQGSELQRKSNWRKLSGRSLLMCCLQNQTDEIDTGRSKPFQPVTLSLRCCESL